MVLRIARWLPVECVILIVILCGCMGPPTSRTAGPTRSMPPRVAVLYPGEWLTLWKALGPFANDGGKGLERDFLAPSGGERAFSADSSIRPDSVLASSPTLRLVTARPGADGAVDFQEAFGPRENAIAYAWCDFLSADEGNMALRLGNDDALRVRLNGQEVFSRHGRRSAAPDQDRVMVAVRPGLNRVLVKLDHGAGDWRFFLRIGGPAAAEPAVSESPTPQ